MPALRQAAVVTLFDRWGKLLLVEHNYGAKFFALPGGLIEDGEAPHEAAVRETREEIGCAPDLDYLVGMYDIFVISGFPRTLAYVFYGRIQDPPYAADTAELNSVGWFDTGSLPDPIGPLIPHILDDLDSGHRGIVRTMKL